jgi:hypothetical protein
MRTLIAEQMTRLIQSLLLLTRAHKGVATATSSSRPSTP